MKTTIDNLTEGQTVTAINGKPTPFPYVVARVINVKAGKDTFTTVKYAHGGAILPCDPKSAVATVA